jgi:transketolase
MLEFAKAYPDRFIEVGVAEQNLAGLGAGFAHEGFIPFIASYATFSPGKKLGSDPSGHCLFWQ